MAKFLVTHYEYRNLSGYRVPLSATDGEYETSAEAEQIAKDLCRRKHKPHFIVLVPDAGIGLPLPEPERGRQPKAMAKAA